MDELILALFEQFKEGQYSLSNFLDAIKYQTGLFIYSHVLFNIS